MTASRSGMLVAIVGAALVAVGASPSGSTVGPMAYGFSVSVAPDEEFADFAQCGMSAFRLSDGVALPDPPRIRVAAGGGNGMEAHLDGLEVAFDCSVSADMTEATYELSGRRDGRVVMDYLGTVRMASLD